MRLRGIIGTVLVAAVLLILLRRTGSFLVDLVWFSAVGYLDVFWTIFGAKAILFFAVFVGSTAFLWVNGTLAFRFARRRGPLLPVAFERGSATVRTLPETLPELLASLCLPWRLLIAGVAIVLGVLIAAGEIENWDVVPPVHPPGAVRPERSPLRQGHRLLSLLASRLCRAQELAAADARLERSRRRRGVLGARRHRTRRADAGGCHPRPSPTAPLCLGSSSR